MTARPGKYPCFTGWALTPELFQEPPEDFRPATYWFWSREVDPATFKDKLAEMKAAGIHAFLIQPRLGYPMEKYLSQEYFDQYRTALELARELDMRVSIYDEYNWITGHAGGRTVAQNDAYRESHTFWVEVPVQDGKPQEELKLTGITNLLTTGHKEALTWLYDGAKPEWADWQVMAAFTYRRTGETIVPGSAARVDSLVHIAEGEKDYCQLAVTGDLDKSATHLLVFVNGRCITSRLIDYLSPEAVQAFIEVGYEPYYRELKEYWDLIWAMFCDEPYSGLYTWDQITGKLGTSLMYNPGLYEEFAERWGYRIEDHLYALIWNGEKLAPKWCSDFYQTYAERAQRVFFEPLKEWSHARGVKFVGHELMTQLNGHWAFTTDHGFDVVANFGADHFGIGALKDVSTTDSGTFRRNISAKLASSIAHIYRKNGSMLEQYTPGFPTDKQMPAARGDWDLTAQRLTAQMDFYAIQGLTQFLWHGYFQSNDVVGDNTALYSQRFDFPPGINYEPWFRYFAWMSRRNARLAYFLSHGTHVAPVAVLYPLRTYWSKGRLADFSQEGGFYSEYLSRLHVDFDFIDERNLVDAQVKDGRLWIADEGYQAVVLPAVTTLANHKTMAKLEEFVAQGGAVIFSGTLPQETQAAGADPELRERAEALVAGSDRVIYFPEPLYKQADGTAKLAEAAAKLGIRSLSITVDGEEDLGSYYCLREDEDYLYLAVMNEEERSKALRIKLKGVQGTPELWDITTGEVRPHLVYDVEEDGIVISYMCEPLETNCFRVKKSVQPAVHFSGVPGRVFASEADERKVALRFAVDHGESFIITVQGLQGGETVEVWEKGALLAAYTAETGMQMAAVPERTLPQALTLSEEWELHLPGGEAQRIRTCRGWEEQGLAAYAGAAAYVQNIELPAELAAEELKLTAADVCHTMEVTLNGTSCGKRLWPPYEVALGDAGQAGQNSLSIVVTNTAGNAMYHNTQYDTGKKAKSGLIGPVQVKPYRSLEVRVVR